MSFLKKISSFFVSSLGGFLLKLLLLFIVTEYIKVYYILSAIVAFVFATTLSFILNKTIAFKKRGKIHQEYTKFFLTSTTVLALDLAILYSLTQYLHIYYILSQIIAGIITFFFNSAINHLWTFKDN